MLYIDAFNHILPKKYQAVLEQKVPNRDMSSNLSRYAETVPTLLDLDARFRLMDSVEGYMQVLTLAAPTVESVASPEVAVDLCRFANDEMAELVEKYPDRFAAATTLLDYGFGAYEAAPLPKLEAQPLQITVRGSAAGSVPLDYSALPETVLVEKGSGASLHTELTLPEELEAPVEQGQTLGKAAVYQGEALLEEYEVRAAADAPRMTVRDAIGLLWQSLTGAA